MATYTAGRDQLNDMERTSGGATKTLDMGTVKAGLVDGDIVTLGALPRESLTTDIRIIVKEGFNVGGFELGYYDYPSEGFVSIVTVGTAALVNKDFTIVVDMPITGVLDNAGNPYTGNRGSIWNGEVETVLALRWAGGTPTSGNLKVVTTHTYYGTKSGEYGLAHVPMKPYKR